MARAAALLLALSTAWAATKEDDKVTSIPGFEAQFQQGLGFDVYSGFWMSKCRRPRRATIRSWSTTSSTPAAQKTARSRSGTMKAEGLAA